MKTEPLKLNKPQIRVGGKRALLHHKGTVWKIPREEAMQVKDIDRKRIT